MHLFEDPLRIFARRRWSSHSMVRIRNDFCARHRLAYGIVLVACGLIAALASFAWWVDQAPSATVIGCISLIATFILAMNNFVISRLCVTRSGIQRVAWLGLVNQSFPFESVLGIDLGHRPGLVIPATALEIRLRNNLLVLNDKEYSDETLRGLIVSILAKYPQAPISEAAKRYARAST
jgi:hypothetical protein